MRRWGLIGGGGPLEGTWTGIFFSPTPSLSASWMPEIEQFFSAMSFYHIISALEPADQRLNPLQLLAKINLCKFFRYFVPRTGKLKNCTVIILVNGRPCIGQICLTSEIDFLIKLTFLKPRYNLYKVPTIDQWIPMNIQYAIYLCNNHWEHSQVERLP